jgi:prepilin-type N-terminal cleavage/methylation domain-containing protein
MRATDGFSMPEILAVLTIIAILAAIAVALFSSTPAKAMGARAKEEARSAATAAQAIATDNGGDYTGLSAAELNQEEPQLPIAESGGEPWVASARGQGSEYEIVIKTPSGDEFKIAQNPSGEVSRTCSNATTKAPCAGAQSGSW